MTSADVLIISLAVNDILLAGIVLPQKIHELSHTEHVFECKYTFLRICEQFLSASLYVSKRGAY